MWCNNTRDHQISLVSGVFRNLHLRSVRSERSFLVVWICTFEASDVRFAAVVFKQNYIQELFGCDSKFHNVNPSEADYIYQMSNVLYIYKTHLLSK